MAYLVVSSSSKQPTFGMHEGSVDSWIQSAFQFVFRFDVLTKLPRQPISVKYAFFRI